MTANTRLESWFVRCQRWTIGVVFAVFAVSAGCGNKTNESPIAPADMGVLEPGVVARVGAERVFADEVARIAEAQSVGLVEARELAIRDALYASQARADGMDEDRDTQLIVNAALARRMLRHLLDDADRAGPVTDEELENVMKRRWLELDRPESFRVVHAVVRTKENADEATRRRAEAVARAIREAVMPAAEMAKTTPISREPSDPVAASFKRAAEGVTRDGFEIKVEELPPIAADARMISPGGGGVETSFAEGASKLETRGALSDIVLTSYGFHVLLLLERIPEARMPLEERRKSVGEEVRWGRSSAARAKLLERLRPGVLVGREVETLLVMVPVSQ
jgi:peptidyl-prolyl cis-trans isomerase C